MTLTLPYPPSVNRMWRNVRGRTILSAEGRAYRQRCGVVVSVPAKLLGRLAVRVELYTPDARRRDVDNALKAPLDVMKHVGVYEDDSQIDRLEVVRAGIDRTNPRVEVEVVEL